MCLRVNVNYGVGDVYSEEATYIYIHTIYNTFTQSPLLIKTGRLHSRSHAKASISLTAEKFIKKNNNKKPVMMGTTTWD